MTAPQNARYIVESGGIPKAGEQKDELKRKFAERLGILRRPDAPVVMPPRLCEVVLGNPELPVYSFREQIVETVQKNPITIIVAETGAGKSTQVPQFLMREGFQITVTQPRRLAATMLASQIEREVTAEDKLGSGVRGIVGHHTAESSTLTHYSRIALVTDGLRLAQELNQQGDITDEALIIDEAHEANTNIEVTLALVKQVIADRPHMRVVIMSATVDTNKYVKFFEEKVGKVPVIEIPGRTFGVQMETSPSGTATELAVKAALPNQTVLVFLPGLREIEREMAKADKILEKKGVKGVSILPLHGNLSQAQQQAVEISFDGPRIIFATNVAQTSITIPDVDVVIDTGLERRVEIDNDGVDSLRLNPISQADCRQRAGRCGRTKPGLYILTRMSEEYDFIPIGQRQEYPVPEILRTNVHKNTLAVAAVGLDFAKLELLHPVSKHSINRSKYHLRLLGAFDEQNQITQRGLRMNEFSVRPSLARMLVHAEDQNFSPKLKAYVASMVACIESGDLPDYMEGEDWRSLATNRESDMLSQLDMLLWAQGKDKRQWVEAGLNVRRVLRAQELKDKLIRKLSAYPGALSTTISDQDKALIIDSVISGMVDFVYQRRGSEYADALGRYAELRELSSRSVVDKPELVVATPYKIPPNVKHTEELHILQHVTGITPDALGRVAAHLCDWQQTGITWRGSRPRSVESRLFRGRVKTGEWREVDAKWSTELQQRIVDVYTSRPNGIYKELLDMKKELEGLWHMTQEVEVPKQEAIDKLVEYASRKKVMSPGELDSVLRQVVLEKKISINKYIGEKKRLEIENRSPRSIDAGGLHMEVRYRNGEAILAHPDNFRDYLLDNFEDFKLPDGRDILISYRHGQRDTRRYTLRELRKLLR